MPELTTVSRDLYYHEVAYVRKLEAVERAARLLIREGLRTTPDGLIVRESADKSDPHYRLCEALEAIGPLKP